MRILQIMPGRKNGGAETYFADMVLSLHEAGVDQAVVMSEIHLRFNEIRAAGVRVYPEVLRPPLQFMQQRLIARLIRHVQPDLIHCWMRRAASLVTASAAPIVGWFGGYYDVAHFPMCKYLIGVTDDIVAHMRRAGMAETRTFMVPTFSSVEDASPVDRASLDTPQEAFVILTLSRLHEKKGLDILLRATADMPHCHLWIAGDGPLRDQLERLAAGLGMKERVHFLGWRTDRGALLRAADAMAIPSRYEPFGTSVIDAWKGGCPVIAAAATGPAATITDGENGLLFPIDDIAALRDVIERLQQDKELRAKLAAKASATYDSDYSRDVVTKRMITTYEKILRDHASTVQQSA